MTRYDNRKSGRAQTLVTCEVESHPCYGLVVDASVGHGQARVAVDHVPLGPGGSTPSRLTRFDGSFGYRKAAWFSARRGGFDSLTGYCLAFESPGRVAELVDARASEAFDSEAWEFDSPPGHSTSVFSPRRAGARLALMRPTSRFESGAWDCGRAGAHPSLIGSGEVVRLPCPQLSSRPGRRTGKAAGLRGRCLWARLPHRRL